MVGDLPFGLERGQNWTIQFFGQFSDSIHMEARTMSDHNYWAFRFPYMIDRSSQTLFTRSYFNRPHSAFRRLRFFMFWLRCYLNIVRKGDV